MLDVILAFCVSVERDGQIDMKEAEYIWENLAGALIPRTFNKAFEQLSKVREEYRIKIAKEAWKQQIKQ